MEKDKDISLQLKNNEDNVKVRLVLDKSYANMLATEIDKLFLWYHIRKKYQGGKTQKLEMRKTICVENQAPASYEKWTVEDEENLDYMNRK